MYLVFLRKWWSEIFYLIRLIIPPVKKLCITFFLLFFSLSRKPIFTGTLAILGCVHRFSNSNKIFSHKLNTDSESAQKTESNEVPFKSIWQLSFFDFYTAIQFFDDTLKNEKKWNCYINENEELFIFFSLLRSVFI